MNYAPDQDVAMILGPIIDSLKRAEMISHSYKRAPALMALLPGGELYFDSSVELDTDGLPNGGARGDGTWQAHTSLRYADGSSLNPDRVPYYVLPLPAAWPLQFGISLGDYAAVVRGKRLAFAVFGDFGKNPGEGSIELLRQLGAERLRPDGTIINAGVGKGVVTIVFPGSGLGGRPKDEATLLSDIERKAPGLFAKLGGLAAGQVPQPEIAAADLSVAVPKGLGQRVVDAALAELNRFGGCAEQDSPLRERIAEYWAAVGEKHDGADHDAYWSAAFVSFMVRLAGGERAFKCSGQHSVYVNRAIRDKEAGSTGRFWAFRTSEAAPAVGDILAMNRGNMRLIDFEEARASADFPSHCDIVTSVDAQGIHTVGGNVGASPGTVGAKRFRWSGGALQNARNAKQQVYAVLRPPAGA